MLLNLHIKPNILRSVIISTMILLSISSFSQWTLVLEKEEVKVFNKPSNNGMSYYKVETVIKTSITDLYRFFTNFSDYPAWVNNCSYVNVLKQTPDTIYVYYSFFNMPWPASDRDGISELNIIKLTSDTIIVSSKPSELEVPIKKRVIRVENFEEYYVLIKKSDNSVFLTMQGGYDPGGYIPDWLVRKMMKFGPFDVIMNIKKLVE